MHPPRCSPYLFHLTKALCREAIVRQVQHPDFWTINSHLLKPYPAPQPSDALRAQMQMHTHLDRSIKSNEPVRQQSFDLKVL